MGKPPPSSEVLVRRIGRDAVVKLPVDESSTEARNIQLVRSQTSIPVPAVLREVKDP